MFPTQARLVSKPFQATTLPMQVTAQPAQLDINSIMSMMLPMIIMVMMMKMMMGAVGEGKPKLVEAS